MGDITGMLTAQQEDRTRTQSIHRHNPDLVVAPRNNAPYLFVIVAMLLRCSQQVFASFRSLDNAIRHQMVDQPAIHSISGSTQNDYFRC